TFVLMAEQVTYGISGEYFSLHFVHMLTELMQKLKARGISVRLWGRDTKIPINSLIIRVFNIVRLPLPDWMTHTTSAIQLVTLPGGTTDDRVTEVQKAIPQGHISFLCYDAKKRENVLEFPKHFFEAFASKITQLNGSLQKKTL